jgi:hypothetical protein
MERHIYRPAIGWQVFGAGVGAAIIAIGVTIAVTTFFQVSASPDTPDVIAYPMAAMAIYMGFCVAANANKAFFRERRSRTTKNSN